jgi:large subunit ribosomal protein L6
MSRIGKQPVVIPSGVDVNQASGKVTVKGPKGTLQLSLRDEVVVAVEGKEALVTTSGKGSARAARAYHGMTRALLNNMVSGVSKGFEKKLEIIGVGWNAKAQGSTVVLNIGYCHPVNIPVPQGIAVETPKPTQITISGADRQVVGQLAADIRKVRPPEPYKGKGIRYEGEFVRRKAGKSFGS